MVFPKFFSFLRDDRGDKEKLSCLEAAAATDPSSLMDPECPRISADREASDAAGQTEDPRESKEASLLLLLPLLPLRSRLRGEVGLRMGAALETLLESCDRISSSFFLPRNVNVTASMAS